MRGHIIAEEHFLHQGIDHQVYVTAIENTEHEYRFEVRCIAPGGDHPETIYEKLVDFSSTMQTNEECAIEQLIRTEIAAIKNAVNEEEDIHAHDP